MKWPTGLAVVVAALAASAAGAGAAPIHDTAPPPAATTSTNDLLGILLTHDHAHTLVLALPSSPGSGFLGAIAIADVTTEFFGTPDGGGTLVVHLQSPLQLATALEGHPISGLLALLQNGPPFFPGGVLHDPSLAVTAPGSTLLIVSGAALLALWLGAARSGRKRVGDPGARR